SHRRSWTGPRTRGRRWRRFSRRRFSGSGGAPTAQSHRVRHRASGVAVVNFLTILPMAFVMIAGPQILSAVLFATSENWQRTSAAYVLGAALSITAFVTAAYYLLNGVSD